MDSWTELELQGKKRRHQIRLTFDFQLGGNGVPAQAAIKSGEVMLVRDGQIIRQRDIPEPVIKKLRVDRNLEELLFDTALRVMPIA